MQRRPWTGPLGEETLARAYWEREQQLYPDNWSFHRSHSGSRSVGSTAWVSRRATSLTGFEGTHVRQLGVRL